MIPRLLTLSALICSQTNLFGVATEYFPQSVASGDPRDTSVILWTRLVDGDTSANRQASFVVSEMGSLADAGSVEPLKAEGGDRTGIATAPEADDGCLKLKVSGLKPNTTYYYQFSYDKEGVTHRSAIGRTKTAPASSDDEVIRLAVLNCADYGGRYYNTLKHLNDQEAESVDFVLHLGDYIYETTTDPAFQGEDPNRPVKFTDEAGAIKNGNFFAASSLSNYRELYKTYRSDPNLIRAHELFPWVVIWDDHEYSDDHHAATAVYFDGRVDEVDEARKRNAERAWLEFIPCDIGLDATGSGLEIDDSDLYPNSLIYRALNFGQHLDLLLTDNRSHRPDHLIPEDAFPGTVAMTEPVLKATVEATISGAFALVRDRFDAYFDIDAPQSYFGAPAENFDQPNPAFQGTPFAGTTFKQALVVIVATATGGELASLPEGKTPKVDATTYAAAVVRGRLSARWVNALFGAAGFPVPISDESMATMSRGLSFFTLGKTSNFSDIGARYQLVYAAFQLYAGFLYASFLNPDDGIPGKDQAFYDAAQQTFLSTALRNSVASGRAWRIIASSSPFSPIRLNLGDLPEGVSLPTTGTVRGEAVGTLQVEQTIPQEFLLDFLINADEVAGFPDFRQGIIDSLAATGSVIVSGDIHAAMLGENRATNGEVVVDFIAPSTSASSFRRAFQRALATIEGLVAPGYRTALEDPTISFEFDGKDAFLAAIDRMLERSSPELSYVNTRVHGYLVVTAAADRLAAEYREIDETNVAIDLSAVSAEGTDVAFTRRPFVVTKEGGELKVTAAPVSVALSKTDTVKVGERIVLAGVPTVAGVFYKVTFSEDVGATGWNDVDAEDVVAVDGAEIAGGEIRGSGGQVGIVIKVPTALEGAPRAFFRVEIVE